MKFDLPAGPEKELLQNPEKTARSAEELAKEMLADYLAELRELREILDRR